MVAKIYFDMVGSSGGNGEECSSDMEGSKIHIDIAGRFGNQRHDLEYFEIHLRASTCRGIAGSAFTTGFFKTHSLLSFIISFLGGLPCTRVIEFCLC